MQLDRNVFIAQILLFGSRDAQPFNQQREAGTVAVLDPGQIDDGGMPVGDGFAAGPQQRRDGVKCITPFTRARSPPSGTKSAVSTPLLFNGGPPHWLDPRDLLSPTA